MQGQFWQSDTDLVSAIGGQSFFTTNQDKTGVYIPNRPIRITSSAINPDNGGYIWYAYVNSSSYTTQTTVNLMSGNDNSPFVLTGSISDISYATQDFETLWLYSTANLSSEALNSLRGTSVAMAIALG